MKTIISLLTVIVIALAAYAIKVSWYERYIWPNGPIDDMQALAPVDKKGWPSPPVNWRSEQQLIEIATPDGLQNKRITYFVNSIGIDFVHIQAGSYKPRYGYRHSNEITALRRAEHWKTRQPPSVISISRAFYLSAFEITNKQYEMFDPEHKSKRPEYQQKRAGDQHPVEGISWLQAQKFARWLSEKEGRVYRLPTAAEWDYAVKAGTNTRFYWGDEYWDGNKANLGGLHSNQESYRLDGYKKTAPIGMYPANPWGLYDMVGNTYEWVADWWHPPVIKSVTDPTGPEVGKIRMAKGGSWSTRHYASYNEENDGNNPADLRDVRGIRLLVEIPL